MIRPEEMPYASGLTYRDGVPIIYDPADYPAAFDLMLARLDYARWREEQARRRGGARPLGIGLSAYVEGTGIGPFEGADVRVDPDGTVFVHVGVSAQGQAHETTLAQIGADELAVPIESVVVRGGDTGVVGYGMGTIASRVAAVAGPAVARTAAEVARKARLVAAEMLECAPDDVVLADGRVHVAGRARPRPAPRRGGARGGAEPDARHDERARAQSLRLLLPGQRHVGVRRAGRRRRGRRRGRARCACSRTSPSTTAAGPSIRWWSRGSSTAASPRASAARSWRS